MSQEIESQHIPHEDPNTAYHMDWAFRREAAIFVGDHPIAPNLYPIGSQLRKWMLREGQMTFLAHSDRKLPNAPTNPYSYHAYILMRSYADILNDSHAFVVSTAEREASDSEIQYIRLYSELVLYTARLCEVLIKQLLFCTTFRPGDYEKAALGALLSRNCSGCGNSKEKRHKVSLLGSLAHRYGFCGGYEECLHNHVKIVNRRRNLEAAHSGVIEFVGRTTNESRALLGEQMALIGEELIHMLEHIGDIEIRVIDEMKSHIETEEKKARAEVRKFLKEITHGGG